MKGVPEIQGIDSKLELQNKNEVVYFQNFHIFISSWCAPKPETTRSILNSAIVNTRCKSQKGAGGLGQIKKYLSENNQIFFDQRGGSHPIQKGFIRFFGIICQKMGVLYIKKNW